MQDRKSFCANLKKFSIDFNGICSLCIGNNTYHQQTSVFTVFSASSETVLTVVLSASLETTPMCVFCVLCVFRNNT